MTKHNSTAQKPKKQCVTDTESFIEKAIGIHGCFYGYSKSLYTKAHEKLIITCPNHGDFNVTPSNHYRGGGCKKCANDALSKKNAMSFDLFIKKAKKLHGSKYSYVKSSYVKCSDKLIVVCKEHGEFNPTGSNHLQGSGCRKCIDDTRKMTAAEFKEKAREIHAINYDYSKVEMDGSRKTVLIGCPLHGFFKQRVVNHLNGKGCATCGMASGGWTRTSFQSACTRNNSAGLGFLYVLRCKNDAEMFYKIGITSRSIKRRFNCKKLMPYDFEIKHIIKQQGSYVYNLEQRLKELLVDNKHIPLIKFGGHLTECFSTIKPIESLLNQLSSTDQLQLIA